MILNIFIVPMPYETKHYNMKTIDDFKGTKGDFLQSGAIVYALQEAEGKYKDGKPVLINRFSASVEGNKVPSKELEANAKLFANSKKALEALIGSRQVLFDVIYTEYSRREGHDDAVKSALNHPIIKEIDSVIEQSL